MMSVRRELLQKALELMNSLHLHTIDQDWVDQVWNSMFTEKIDLPLHYEEVMEDIDVMRIFQRLTRACEDYCNSTNSNTADETTVEKSFWSEVIGQNVKSGNLLALLSYYINTGLDNAANQQAYTLALVATGLYLSLIALPGSGPYKIFQPVLFSKAFDTIQVSKRLSFLQSSQKRRSAPSSQAARANGKRSRSSQKSSQMSQLSQGDDDEDDEEGELSADDRDHITHLALKVLESVRLMLTHFSMKRSPVSLELTAKTLINIAKLETNTVLKISEESAYVQPVQRLAKSAYLAMLLIPSELHGELKQCTGIILKELIPLILMIVEEGTSITNKGLSVIKDNCIGFVSALMTKQPSLSPPLLTLIQHIAATAPDKTDYRREAADSILVFFSLLDTNHYRIGLRWFLKYSMVTRTSARLVSLEVLNKLLYTGQERSRGATGAQQVRGEEHRGILNSYLKFIFAAIYRRTMDSAITVRTQALKVLGEITMSESECVRELVALVQANTRAQNNQDAWIQIIKEGDDNDQDLFEVNSLPLWKDLVQNIQFKALDNSVFVRKSALCVIENILGKSGVIAGELLRVLVTHCRDPSMAIRKQIISSLTELLLRHPTQLHLVDSWVQGALPLVKDVESKVAEKLCESLYDCLLRSLVHKSKVSTELHALPWAIMRSVEKKKMELYVSQAVSAWAKEGKITKLHITNLQSYLRTEESTQAWLLLSIITNYVPCSDPDFVLQHFNTCLENPDTNLSTLLNVSKVLFASVNKLSVEAQTTLLDHLLELVKTFRLPVEVISKAVDIITAILKKSNPSVKSYTSAQEGWTVELLTTIEDLLADQILEIPTHTHSEKTLSRHIFTLGELALLSYSRVTKKLFLLLQSIVFFKNEATAGRDAEEGSTPVFSQEVHCRFSPSDKLRALAVGTLGKMCLQNEDQAKKIIPAFGQILDSTNNPAIKNNIMIVLSDMCVRYASLVDPLIPQMTACLKDCSLTVRRTTLIQLIHLLQEDYLKIRGKAKFFLCLIQTLLDPSQEIQELTKFYIEQRLLKRSGNIMYTNFLEAIFYYNMYQGHERYNKYELTEREKASFVLQGQENRENRYILYRYMLQHMNDEERFKTSYNLTQEVLQGILDQKIGLEQATAVLKDTFYLLSCEEIKLTSLSKKAGPDDEVEGQDQVTETQMRKAVSKAVITAQVMRSVMEIIVPTVIELKKFLEARNSSFLEDLFNYLKKLMEEHKVQMSDILAGDPQLAKEIAYDLKKLDERREAQRLEAERLTELRRQAVAQGRHPSSRPGSRSGSRPGSAAGTPIKSPNTSSSTSARPGSIFSGAPGPAVAGQDAADSNGVPSASTTPQRTPRNILVAQDPNTGTRLRAEQRTPSGMLKAKSKDKVLQRMMDDFRVERRKSTSGTDLRGPRVEGMETSCVVERPNETLENVDRDPGADLAPTVETRVPAQTGTPEDDIQEQPENIPAQVNAKEKSVNISTSKRRSKRNSGSKTITEPNIEREARPGQPEEEPVEPVLMKAPARPGRGSKSKKSSDPPPPRAARSRSSSGPDISGETASTEQLPNGVTASSGGPPMVTEPSPQSTVATPDLAKGVPPVSSLTDLPSSGPALQTEGESSRGEELNKSKRISGKGMPRGLKTPQTRRFHQLRAVSTPQANKTLMASNLTFMNETMDLSSITVLSPASSIGSSRDAENQDTSSFRFNRRSKDAFDVMVDGGKKNRQKGKEAANGKEGANGKDDGKRKDSDSREGKESGKKSVSSSSSLTRIAEEH